MQRKIVFVLFSVLLMISGCAEKENSNTDSKENQVDVESASNPTSSLSDQTIDQLELTDEEKAEVDLMRKYFDVDAYVAQEGRIIENKLDGIIDEIEVGGQILKIGMSYEEVIEKGFSAYDTEFQDKEISSALNYTSDFQDADHHTVCLGFIGEDDQIVADGVLYYINVNMAREKEAASSFLLAGIDNDTTLPEILSELGSPYRIDTGSYSEYRDTHIEYMCKDASLYVSFYIDLDTEKIISATLEGYAE